MIMNSDLTIDNTRSMHHPVPFAQWCQSLCGEWGEENGIPRYIIARMMNVPEETAKEYFL